MKFTDEEIKTIILSIWHERVLEDAAWMTDMSTGLRTGLQPEAEAILLKTARGDREIFLALVAVTVWARSFRDDWSEFIPAIVNIASSMPLDQIKSLWKRCSGMVIPFTWELANMPDLEAEPVGNC